MARLVVVSDKSQLRQLYQERGWNRLFVIEGQWSQLEGAVFNEVEDLTYSGAAPPGWWEQVYSQMGGPWPSAADEEQERGNREPSERFDAKDIRQRAFAELSRHLNQEPEPFVEVNGPVRAAIRKGIVLLDGIADLDFIREPGRRRWGGRIVVGERTAASLVKAGVLEVLLPNGRAGEFLATRHLVGKATVEVEGIGPAPFGD